MTSAMIAVLCDEAADALFRVGPNPSAFAKAFNEPAVVRGQYAEAVLAKAGALQEPVDFFEEIGSHASMYTHLRASSIHATSCTRRVPLML